MLYNMSVAAGVRDTPCSGVGVLLLGEEIIPRVLCFSIVNLLLMIFGRVRINGDR